MADAESVILTIEARVDEANRKLVEHGRVVDGTMSRVEQSATRAEHSIRRSATLVVDNTGRMANASRNLGRQFADVGASLASGSSPFLVLAQQAPQVADALADTGGRAAKVAAFFAGPWGAALLAAASVVGVLASAMFDGADADDAKTKSSKTLQQATLDLTAATKGAIATSQQNEDQAYREAAAQLEKARAVRVATVELLKAARAQAVRDNLGAVGGRSANFGGNYVAQNSERDVARLNALIAQQGTLINQTGDAVRRADIPRRQRAAQEATDGAAAATGRYDRAIAKLNDRYAAGKVSAKDYEAQNIALIRRRDAEVEATNKSDTATKRKTGSDREAAKAVREHASAQRELEQALDAVTSKFDPARKAVADFNDTLAQIDKLVGAGKLSQGDAIGYKISAAADQAKAVAEAANKQLQGVLGYEIGGANDPIQNAGISREGIAREQDYRRDTAIEANSVIAEDLRRKQEDQIRTVANLYEDLFQGGTKAIWQDFKSIGFRVIAETLARFTISQASGSGGSIGGAFASAFGSIFGKGGFKGTGKSQASLDAGQLFQSGGYTGDGPRDEVAGLVHKGEYVVPASAVNRIGVANLEAMANGQAASSMAGVSAIPAASQGGGSIRVQISLDNDMLTARVVETSAQVSAVQIQRSAGAIAQNGANIAVAQLSRPRL
ncbi:phage tail length tape measure family protein [Sphingobium sp. BS19]|uniref:phage tail length tape measure family protein n=1 Tax=Sphingobium sp. BS19 TaxID=3018973 RepID=UPI0022ED926D|nr:phage tail length tape measure family protein [Sphingobium sp. BS19]GLI99116.1 hypothetical protein Sbs19_29340 [Sphingobium sp. BS19]